MEPLEVGSGEVGRVLCCECGAVIEPNAANMCAACLRTRVDVTEGIPKQSQLLCCKFCSRYLIPPNAWVVAQPCSKELMSLALKKLKPSMQQVRLIDASFVWTEEHSKRLKIKITVQKEVLNNVILQQTFIVEYVIHNQMCDDCRRVEAKDFWRACVQVRQKCESKRTLFYLEQLILRHGAHTSTCGVKPVPTGIDFFFARLQEAKKFVDFVQSALPCRSHSSQELLSHDTKNNTFDYKHTICVEVVPICRDDFIILPAKVAQSLGNLSQTVLCLRVSNVVTLIDPFTGQTADVTPGQYWKNPFEAVFQSRRLVEYYVADTEDHDVRLPPGHGSVSAHHRVAFAWLENIQSVGDINSSKFSTWTHLGHLIKPGDLVLGYDLTNSVVNNDLYDKAIANRRSDVIVVKKVFDRSARQRRRKWKLKRLVEGGDFAGKSSSAENDFEAFMEDLEEDDQIRAKINIYRDARRTAVDEDDNDEEFPPGPALSEMLDDLDINKDVEMADA